MVKELSFRKKLAKSRIVQQFRHRVYIPLIISFDRLNDLKRRVRTQALIDPSDLGFNKFVEILQQTQPIDEYSFMSYKLQLI